MKTYMYVFLLICCLCLSCAPASMKSVEYNSTQGVYEKVKYSSQFEAQDYLIQDKLKILVYGKVRNRYGKDALREEGNNSELADFTIYFSNPGETNTMFTVNSIVFKNEQFSNSFLDQPQEVVIVPKTVEKINVEGTTIDRFDKKCKILVNFTYGQREFVKEIDLSRLTREEAKARKKNLF